MSDCEKLMCACCATPATCVGRGSQTGDVFGLIDGLTALIDAALALPSGNAALEEACERVAWEVRSACGGSVVAAGSGWPTDFDVKSIVARVLGGTAK